MEHKYNGQKSRVCNKALTLRQKTAAANLSHCLFMQGRNKKTSESVMTLCHRWATAGSDAVCVSQRSRLLIADVPAGVQR